MLHSQWHLGWFSRAYLPTKRGFDTFFGSSGNTKDYWNHTISGPQYSCDGIKEWYDFIDCAGDTFGLAAADAFGRYDSRVLTERAVKTISAHDKTKSLYIYVSPEYSVHACIQCALSHAAHIRWLITTFTSLSRRH